LIYSLFSKKELGITVKVRFMEIFPVEKLSCAKMENYPLVFLLTFYRKWEWEHE